MIHQTKSIDLVKQHLVSKIHRGEYREGSRLPSERVIASDLGVPQCRARKALRVLVEDGILSCERGNGYFVQQQSPTKTHIGSVTLITDASWQGEAFVFLSNALAQAGFLHETITLAGEDEVDPLICSILDRERTDHGILLFPFSRPTWGPNLTRAMLEHYPVVQMHRSYFPGRFSCSESNHFEAGLKAAELLHRHGYTRPLYLGYQDLPENVVPDQRLEGFQAGCQTFGIRPHLQLFELPSSDACIECLGQELKSQECDSIFTASAAFTATTATCMLREQVKSGSLGWIGMDAPVPIPGWEGEVDCIVQDRQAEARQAIRIMRELLAKRGNAANQSIAIPPRYLPGTSLSRNES